MTTNIARKLVSKCLFGFGIRNRNQTSQQVRLESYKAAVLKESNKPIVIDELQTVKKLENNQVRVQVNYCSLNTNDVLLFKCNKVKDFIPGYELSGEVLEIGADVKPDVITVGERVAVLSKNRGGFAEQCVVDSTDLWRLPSKIKRRDAAVLVFGHSNALYAFSHLCDVNEKTNIVISTGPAGLGLAAIDMAANIYKTKPTGISDKEEVLTVIRDRGAFKTMTLNSKKLKELKDIDIIYDAVGDTYQHFSGCLKPNGRILCAGPVSSALPRPPLNTWLSVVNIEGLRESNPELYRTIVSDILELAEQSMVSAYISAEFNLTEIDQAIKYIEANKCNGKVLIKVVD